MTGASRPRPTSTLLVSCCTSCLTGLRPREFRATGRSALAQDAIPSPVTAPSEAVRRSTSQEATCDGAHESPVTATTSNVADRRTFDPTASRRSRPHCPDRAARGTRAPLRVGRSAGRGDRAVPRWARRARPTRHSELPGPEVRRPAPPRGHGGCRVRLLRCGLRRRRDVAGTSARRAESRRRARARQSGTGRAGSRRLVRDHRIQPSDRTAIGCLFASSSRAPRTGPSHNCAVLLW